MITDSFLDSCFTIILNKNSKIKKTKELYPRSAKRQQMISLINPFDNEKTKRRSGSGIGGKEARKQRLLTQLRTDGRPVKQKKRRRTR